MNKNLDMLCMSCFTALTAAGAVCPLCGYVEGAKTELPHHLPIRTILNGKYLVGKAIGEGGFGITYIGYDLNLDIRVAIKEYFPSGFASRTATVSETVTPHTGDTDGVFPAGRERFVGEAKRLAHFRNLPGIVMVSDFFAENGTAYIVMEYVEGQTLKTYLAEHGGTMPIDTVLQMLTPIFISLGQVHGGGIIHRDISPDNVMITPDGTVKLLDFGAAREFSESGNKSLSVLLKHGYAPMEQYTTRGKQGPWTDVYALAATIYKAITGKTPEGSMDRVMEDLLALPSRLGVAIEPQQEAALMKALEVRAQDRYQTMDEFFDALNPTASVDVTMSIVGAASRRPLAAESRPYGKAADVPNRQVDSEPQTGGHKVRPYDTPTNASELQSPEQPQEIAGQARNDADDEKPKNRKTFAIIAAAILAFIVIVVIVAFTVDEIEYEITRLTSPFTPSPRATATLPPTPTPEPTPAVDEVENMELTLDMGYGERTGIYSGQMQNGLPNGFGTFESQNPEGVSWLYIGEWKGGRQHGIGSMHWESGQIYQGEWEDGYYHGYGTMISVNGNIYEGDWQDDMRHGYGRYTFGEGDWEGDVYEGGFENGVFHGWGTYKYSDGRVFEGEYQNDKRNGIGTLYRPDGSIEYIGMWEYGQPVD